ncbi:MAG: hypothetical protein EPO62_06975 [Candidatus Nitrosotenuis sp.]|nr:MAG: hypothetical protein EPO62_06975 [Candidatus Nitrosotenuis sp.]
MEGRKFQLGLVACILGLTLILSTGTHLSASQAYAINELKTVSALEKQAAEKKMKDDEKRKPVQKPAKTYSISDIPAKNKAVKQKHMTIRKAQLVAAAKLH